MIEEFPWMSPHLKTMREYRGDELIIHVAVFSITICYQAILLFQFEWNLQNKGILQTGAYRESRERWRDSS